MANDRVFKTQKIIHYPSQTITADQLLDLADGLHMVDISDVNWERIVVEVNVTAHTGTDFNAEMVTTNDPDFDGSDTIGENTLAVKADGSTAMASGNINATGRTMFATSKAAADGSAASDIGKKIGIFFDDNATSVTLEVFIFVQGS